MNMKNAEFQGISGNFNGTKNVITKGSLQDLFDFDFEQLGASKCKNLIGTDEAGRGPAAGPIFAAAVCFKGGLDKNLENKPSDDIYDTEACQSERALSTLYDKSCGSERVTELIQILKGLNDSKQLTEKTRQALFPVIQENTFYSIQPIDENMIDKINILNATCEAMRRACMDVVGQIKTTAIVLVDGNNKIRGYEFPQKTVIKGDAKSAAIAAASILAKVSRDEFMIKLDREFPMYGWKHNKGYLSQEHIEAIKKYGPCKYHRTTFLRNMMDRANIEQQRLF